MAGRRSFGSVRKLHSGRWQVRYTDPDGNARSARRGGKPLTFETKADADAWLALRHSEILRGKWTPESDTATGDKSAPLRTYADAWLAARPLAVLTRELYAALLHNHIYPTLGDTAITAITPAAVRDWHAGLARTTGLRARANAYSLLRTILNSAMLDDELITTNPCRIRNAGRPKRRREPEPATLAELEIMATAMPERYRLALLLAAWCAPRLGELLELRRHDLDLPKGVLRIRRSVAITTKGRIVKGPKSEAGYRTVDIPPHLSPAIVVHLREHAAPGRDGLLFPGETTTGHVSDKTLRTHWVAARAAAGRPELTWHGLRHTGATLASCAGATLAEVMDRLGHSTTTAAMAYQHAAKARGPIIAAALSEMVTGTDNVIQLRKRA